MAPYRRALDPRFFAGASNPWTSGSPTYGDFEDNPAPDFGMPSMPSSSIPTSAALNPANSQPDVTRDIYQPQMRDINARLKEAFQPTPMGVGGTLRHLAGAIVGHRNPQLGDIISGEFKKKQLVGDLSNQYKLTEDAIAQDRAQKAAELNARNIGSEITERGRANDIRQQLVDTKETPPPKSPEEQTYASEIAKGTEPMAAYEKIKNAVDKTKAPSEEDKALSDYLQGHNIPDSPANRDKARSVLKTRDRKATDPEIADLSKQMKIAQLEKLKEPTADEQRRADLARNMNENLNQLEDILNRRPDLFGPMAGRATEARGYIGTSDPDIAALKTIKEQMGMAMVGAHAMRNAQHVETAGNTIVNSYHNEPQAVKGAIAAARKSLQTFQGDEQRRRKAIEGAGTEATTPTGGTVIKYDANGNRVQ